MAKKKTAKATASVSRVVKAANVATRNVMSKDGPQIMATGQSATVRHSERLGTVTGNAPTANTSNYDFATYGFNPADPNIFPWLYAIARQYSLYRWKKLRLVFTTNAPTTLGGEIVLGAFYDIEDAAGWANTAGGLAKMSRLTSTSHYSAGPVWGATASVVNNRLHSEISIDIDVTRAHKRTPWHRIDAAPATDVSDNQAVAAYYAWICSPNFLYSPSREVGALHVDYEIELIHPSWGEVAPTPLALMPSGGWHGSDPPVPGVPPTPPPTLPDPPKPPKPEEDENLDIDELKERIAAQQRRLAKLMLEQESRE